MDLAHATALQRSGIAAWLRGLAAASPGASAYEAGGVVAAVVPVCPERSVVNSVTYDDPKRLGEVAQHHAEVVVAGALHLRGDAIVALRLEQDVGTIWQELRRAASGDGPEAGPIDADRVVLVGEARRGDAGGCRQRAGREQDHAAVGGPVGIARTQV